MKANCISKLLIIPTETYLNWVEAWGIQHGQETKWIIKLIEATTPKITIEKPSKTIKNDIENAQKQLKMSQNRLKKIKISQIKQEDLLKKTQNELFSLKFQLAFQENKEQEDRKKVKEREDFRLRQELELAKEVLRNEPI